MGRVYHRDRLGRFAPKGFSGQTSVANTQRGGRGSRLMSPGKSRSGGGQKITAARSAGTMAKRRGLKPQAGIQLSKKPQTAPKAPKAAPRPSGKPTTAAKTKRKPSDKGVVWGQGGKTRELLKTNARPLNTRSKPRTYANPYIAGNKAWNIKTAVAGLKARGYTAEAASIGGSTIADARSSGKGKTGNHQIRINTNSSHWNDPAANMRRMRRSGWQSSLNPQHVNIHETGHVKDLGKNVRIFRASNSGGRITDSAHWAAAGKIAKESGIKVTGKKQVSGPALKKLAGRVSRYAQTNPSEFIAETYAGLRSGQRYDYQVMRAYRELSGRGSKAIRVTRTRRRK